MQFANVKNAEPLAATRTPLPTTEGREGLGEGRACCVTRASNNNNNNDGGAVHAFTGR